MIVTYGETKYNVGTCVAETHTYRLYLCEETASGRQLLLQIADTAAHNGGLERAAYLLKELRSIADKYEAKHAELKPGTLLSYERLFPELVDGFRFTQQDDRQINVSPRVNILAFAEVDDVRQMVPLSNLTERDGLRIALPSSAWVMGRLLKLLDFVHGQSIAIRSLGANNVLLEPSRHFALVFDWSEALTYQDAVPREVRQQEIAEAARTVFTAIGGDTDTGTYPYDAGDDQRYVDFLWRLASGSTSDAIKAHNRFYELVEQLWGRSFRPFETLPL